MQIEKIPYKGWQNCYRLSNGVVDLVVTADVGPRIVRFGFVDGENELKEYPDDQGKTGGDEFRMYGGHRLWHAPESIPRSYAADNDPLQVEEGEDFVRLTQPVEQLTGVQKEMEISIDPDDAHVTVVHRMRNTNLWAIELAPWAITVMATGGKAIIPLPPRGAHPENLEPTSSLTLWAYTDFSDPRWTLGKKYILLQQDAGMPAPQKIGAMVPDGWAAYARGGHLFVKKFYFEPDFAYPDMGCQVETFTNAEMIELETLAPLTLLDPQTEVEHVEEWYLYQDVPTPENETQVDEYVRPKI
jgi:hypothetical protein